MRAPSQRLRHAAAVGVPGLLFGALVYGLVAGAEPLYESEGVLSVASPALLEQYDRLTEADSTIDRRRDGLERADMGDLQEAAASARKGLGFRRSRASIQVEVDPDAREARVIARGREPGDTRRLANEVMDRIVAQRDELVSRRLASARAELPLAAALARRSVQRRRHADRLRARIAALKQLRTSPGGGITALRLAPMPTKPVAPRIARDVIVAGLLGLLASVSVRELKRRPPALLRQVRSLMRRAPWCIRPLERARRGIIWASKGERSAEKRTSSATDG